MSTEALLQRIDRFQQGHPPVGFAVAVVKKFGDDEAGNLAALVSYYLFFSIFPLLLVFTTVVGFVVASDPDRQQQLLDSALANFPLIGDQIRGDITDVEGSGVPMVVGLLVALWAGMGAIGAMQNAMNSIWDIPRRDRPGFVKQRLRSLGMLVTLALAVTASTVVGGVASGAGTWPLVGRVVVLAPALIVNGLLFLASFRILVNKELPWAAIWPGASLAAVFLTSLQTLGGAYIGHVVQGASDTYGSFTIVIGLLSFLYLQAQLTMLAAEVNVVRWARLHPRGLDQDQLTRADTQALRRYAAVETRHRDETIEVKMREPVASAAAGSDA